jgi:hypothetical protein
LFSERTEITVTHKTSDELAEAIRGKIQRLLNSDVIDVTPIEEPEDEVETELEPELEIAVDEVLSFGSAQSADVEPE